ncbi:MAG: biotin-independent malonate decarboxylase subunit gamma [Burkholderiales bacterium]
MTDLRALLDALFPLGHDVLVEGRLVHGTARSAVAERVLVVGTAQAAAVDAMLALAMADAVLRAMEGPPCPLVFLVDTSGQALKRHEEMLGLNAYLAHLACTVDVARRSGFPSVSIVYGEAVSGGYLSLGLMATRAYALADAQIRVMDLHAMARVTKLPYEQLAGLAKQSPVFAPGAGNYERMGALAAIWPEPTAARIDEALREVLHERAAIDGRLAAGLQRGGRTLGLPTAQAVLRALP